ncbi:MAG: hypothetical protein R2865_04905 [Deinococcales bacterium]
MLSDDLLFSLDLPMTLSAYLGLGFDSTKGFDIAWHASLRYYLEELPLVWKSPAVKISLCALVCAI